MLSIRALSRLAPRTISRLSAPSVCRPFSTVRLPSLLQTTWEGASRPTLTAAFSSSRVWQEKEGEGKQWSRRQFEGLLVLIAGLVDEELVAKIESELQLEKEMRDTDEVPDSVKEFLGSSPFKVRQSRDAPPYMKEQLSNLFSSMIPQVNKKSCSRASSAMKGIFFSISFSGRCSNVITASVLHSLLRT